MLMQAAGLNHTPGTLFALPLLDFPAGFIKAFIEWELPKDRHQDDHYLHPAVPLVSLAFHEPFLGSRIISLHCQHIGAMICKSHAVSKVKHSHLQHEFMVWIAAAWPKIILRGGGILVRRATAENRSLLMWWQNTSAAPSMSI